MEHLLSDIVAKYNKMKRDKEKEDYDTEHYRAELSTLISKSLYDIGKTLEFPLVVMLGNDMRVEFFDKTFVVKERYGYNDFVDAENKLWKCLSVAKVERLVRNAILVEIARRK